MIKTMLPIYNPLLHLCHLLKKIYYLPLLLLILNGQQARAVTAFTAPDLGGGSSALSQQQEQQLGVRFMQQVRQQLPLVTDSISNNYIRHLGLKIASHSPRPYLAFDFFIVRSRNINAFAGPGGYIGINSGLILATKNEDQLAAVLAHEISHITQRHIARGLERQKELQWSAIAGMIAALAIGTQSSDAGVGAIAASQAVTSQAMLGFSRQYEQEADAVGEQTLQAAGYSTQGMSQFLSILLAQHYPDQYDDLSTALSSHPSARRRAASALDLAQNNHNQQGTTNNNLFMLIKTRIAVITHVNSRQLANDYQQQLKLQPNNNTAIRYGYCLALLKSQQLHLAMQQIDLLIKQFPQQPIFYLTQAKIASQQNKQKLATTILAKQYQAHPDYLPLALQYATLLKQSGDNQQALKLLTPLASSEKNNLLFLRLFASIQYASGYKVKAYQTQAQLAMAQGKLQQAKALLTTALKLADKPIMRTQIKRKLSEINQQMKLKK